LSIAVCTKKNWSDKFTVHHEQAAKNFCSGVNSGCRQWARSGGFYRFLRWLLRADLSGCTGAGVDLEERLQVGWRRYLVATLLSASAAGMASVLIGGCGLKTLLAESSGSGSITYH
jgi:hypothetical protein